ncbi:alpha/beta hydrolase [Sporolactobacillus sp. KGMB 08714]|uniref:alpha/beta hydrolase n=1 Tax=Sporolactobacillus sp. KGMB 08714 TaxID=3064704 RepID=UPI002FBF178C
MKPAAKFLLTSTAGAAGALAAVGVYLSNKIMYYKKSTEEKIIESETKTHRFFSMRDFEAQNKEVISFESPFGYRIHGYYIPADPSGSKKFMIFCHGVTVSLLTSIKYAKLFLNRGFNVVLYDERRHGRTGGRTSSYGYYEKDDLAAVVRWVHQRFGEDILLGIHGESMGAATLLQYAGLVEDSADFYIADCPFSDFTDELRYLLKNDYHLPEWPILPVTALFLRLRDGYRLSRVSPLLGVPNIKHPVLFIHSKNDPFIPAGMTEKLYQAKADKKQLFIAENGGHACSYSDNPEAYEKVLDRFLKEYVPEMV